MAIIGTFTKQENGSFRGSISNPMFNGKAVITPISIAAEGDPAKRDALMLRRDIEHADYMAQAYARSGRSQSDDDDRGRGR
jgi:uncharacterized protein (DUF736 family)